MATVPENLPHKRRLTVGEYHRMAEVGLLAPDERVELINGEIIDMAPIGISHAACVDRFLNLFARVIGDRAIIRVQNPLRLSDLSEPSGFQGDGANPPEI